MDQSHIVASLKVPSNPLYMQLSAQKSRIKKVTFLNLMKYKVFSYNSDINLAYQIQLKAEMHPDMPIITFENPEQPDEILTYGELTEKGNRLSAAIQSAGIGCGDSFAVVMQNQPEIIIALYAALVTGAVLVPFDPRFGWEKLAYLLRHCKAKGILFSQDRAETIGNAISVLPDMTVLGVKKQKGSPAGISSQHIPLDDILKNFEKNECVPRKNNAGDHAMILYTSGTTGIPKGVRVRTETLFNYLMMTEHIFQYTPDDRLYTGLPLTHANAYSLTVLPSLIFGIPAVISQNFNTQQIWDTCRCYHCTIFSLLGGLASDLYGEPERADDAVNPVRKVISAGTPRQIWKDFEQRFNVTIHEWYGTLEGGFAHNPPGVGPLGSFGKPEQAYIEMKITGDDDRQCLPEETGELLFRFRDKNTVVEYQSDPLTPEDIPPNGWYRTGDMVHQDQNGWFFFDYRKGQGLRHHGEFISAGEVENVLLAHPEIQEACVYGIEAASGAPGEHDLVAAIIPQRGVTPDVKGIFEFCTTCLTPTAIPSYIQLVEAIPKTPTEKAIRRLLKEEFETESPYVYRLNN